MRQRTWHLYSGTVFGGGSGRAKKASRRQDAMPTFTVNLISALELDWLFWYIHHVQAGFAGPVEASSLAVETGLPVQGSDLAEELSKHGLRTGGRVRLNDGSVPVTLRRRALRV